MLLGKPGPVTQFLGEISGETIKARKLEWSQRVRPGNIRKIIFDELEDPRCWEVSSAGAPSSTQRARTSFDKY